MYDFNEHEAGSTDSAFQEGMDLLESDHFEEALEAFDVVLRQQPMHVDALFYRGVALLHLGRLADALRSFREAVDLSPIEPLYLSHYGYALLLHGDLEEALECFDRALEIQPDLHQVKVYKASAMIGMRRLRAARDLLEEVLADHPDEIEAMRLYAGLLAAIGEDEAALEQCDRILRINPNHLEALARKASIYLRKENYVEAIKCLRQQTALNPADLQAWGLLLDAYEKIGRRDAVIAFATEALEEGVEAPPIFYSRAKAFYAEGRLDEALSDLRECIELEERFFDAHLLMARVLLAKGRLRAATTSCARALQIRPSDRAALMLKADLHRRLGEREAELHYLTTLLALDPTDFTLARLKVENLLSRGMAAEARAVVDRFLHRSPDHPLALLLYAELCERCVDEGGARRAYRRLLALPKIAPAAYLAYAAFLVRQTDLAQAARVLDEGAAAFPADAAIQSCRAAVYQTIGAPERAFEILDEYLSRATPNSELYWLHGRSLYMLGRYAEALTAFERARELQNSPRSGAAPNFHCLVAEAYTLHQLGRTVDAIRLLERHAGDYQQFESEYQEALAELYEWQGAVAKAYSIYRRVLESSPDRPSLHYRCARAAARLRLTDAVMAHLRRAVEQNPAFGELALNEPAFSAYRWSPTFNRLLRFEPYKRLARKYGKWAALAGGIGFASWFAWFWFQR
ncbi:TPR domain protein, putative component of TonB system [Candidatus Sumerlaea chitinivorans]|jgi:tetratricopeptide (TPR) repeat protein|uniref:TPR domain protein, putative component of TonB system n=1 Tax=Sumerlaea chitinivorans TaxID=2250252 RepID=A0A2Z4Y5Y7_SUMC1|nr:TPR domain protein, putative component of TonB system [Candidatus Sumerlaea chitinivorans]